MLIHRNLYNTHSHFWTWHTFFHRIIFPFRVGRRRRRCCFAHFPCAIFFQVFPLSSTCFKFFSLHLSLILSPDIFSISLILSGCHHSWLLLWLFHGNANIFEAKSVFRVHVQPNESYSRYYLAATRRKEMDEPNRYLRHHQCHRWKTLFAPFELERIVCVMCVCATCTRHIFRHTENELWCAWQPNESKREKKPTEMPTKREFVETNLPRKSMTQQHNGKNRKIEMKYSNWMQK